MNLARVRYERTRGGLFVPSAPNELVYDKNGLLRYRRPFVMPPRERTRLPWRATFPTIADSDQAWTATGATNHSISLANIAPSSGNLLIFFIGFDGAPTITWNTSGWTQLFEVASGTACKGHGRWKISDGTEGGTNLSITTSASEAKAWNVVVITGHDSATAPEQANATNTTKPDPPNLDPVNWGAEDTKWLAWGLHDCGGADDDNITAVPTNYTLVGSLNQPGTDAGAVGSGLGYRDLNASAENPGAFTTLTNEDTIGVAVAVRPDAGAAVGAFPFIRRDNMSLLVA